MVQRRITRTVMVNFALSPSRIRPAQPFQRIGAGCFFVLARRTLHRPRFVLPTQAPPCAPLFSLYDNPCSVNAPRATRSVNSRKQATSRRSARFRCAGPSCGGFHIGTNRPFRSSTSVRRAISRIFGPHVPEHEAPFPPRPERLRRDGRGHVDAARPGRPPDPLARARERAQEFHGGRRERPARPEGG